MYKVPEFKPKVYLIHRDGRKWEFKNITEAANSLWNDGYLGRYREAPLFASHFKEARPHDYFDDENRNALIGSVIYHDYVVRDEVGEVITPADLKDIRTKERKSKWRSRYDERDHIAEKFFRELPVPYTGGGSWRSGYRHVRTTTEIHDNEFLKYDEDAIEYDIKPRARRTQNLPTAWNDIWRNDYRDHNWKRHRKTQWKEKK